MTREIVIFADESEDHGTLFSNFYGGVAVESVMLPSLIRRLEGAKKALNLEGEVKWTKVSKTYLPKYEKFVDEIFNAIAVREMRMRIMFTQNINDPAGLTAYQRENKYELLYFQFLKNAFGLQYANVGNVEDVRIRFMLDEKTGAPARWRRAKRYIADLTRDPEFAASRVRFPIDQIAQVKSHDHVVLQAVDLVLGSIQWRLNKLGDVKQKGTGRRGVKTVAKNKLYRRINERIQDLRPGYLFNVGGSTGSVYPEETWQHGYRHWLFKPKVGTPRLSARRGA